MAKVVGYRVRVKDRPRLSAIHHRRTAFRRHQHRVEVQRLIERRACPQDDRAGIFGKRSTDIPARIVRRTSIVAPHHRAAVAHARPMKEAIPAGGGDPTVRGLREAHLPFALDAERLPGGIFGEVVGLAILRTSERQSAFAQGGRGFARR